MKTNLLTLVITLVVGIILAGSLLAPVVADARTTTSTEVNYTNESTLFKMASAEETVTISLASGTVTLNGAEVTHTTNSNILLSDAFSVDQFIYQGNWLTRAWYKDSTALSYPTAFNLTFENGTVTGTITTSGTTNNVNDTYTYLYYADESGNFTQISSNVWADVYVNSTKEIVLAGLYYTGSNSTTYTYIDGNFEVEGDYTGSVDFDTESVGIDVLKVTGITVTIGEETFTPYRFLVPAEVTGHTETSISSLLGVIPIMVIVAILMTAIGAIAYRRAD